MDKNWIRRVTTNPDLMAMGHSQSEEDDNLGFGWVYYGLARAYRPKHVVCIGSYRGFTPMMFAKALTDNGGGGMVTFIDPSFVDSFWSEPSEVNAWFEEHELKNVRHHKMTTQDFVKSSVFSELAEVDFLFIDGFHSAEQAQFDHTSFKPLLNPRGLTFFHDSVSERRSEIYGEDESYAYSVRKYIEMLKNDAEYEVLDFPFADGLSLVRMNLPLPSERQPDSLVGFE